MLEIGVDRNVGNTTMSRVRGEGVVVGCCNLAIVMKLDYYELRNKFNFFVKFVH